MRLRRLEDRAAHVSRGILPAPGVFVFEVGENACPVALCLVVGDPGSSGGVVLASMMGLLFHLSFTD